MISSFSLQQCIDCVFNLPLNERQSLVEAKQGVYAIINHNKFCRGEKKVLLEALSVYGRPL